MVPEVAKAILELIILLADIGLVATCSVFHFKRGQLHYGKVHGSITLALFFVAGFITNLFHYFRHESSRISQRSGWKKIKCFLLVFLPCYYLLRWNVKKCSQPDSLTVKCWTSSLRIFYSTGSLVQAVFQSYLVVALWWKVDVPDLDYGIMIVTATFLTLHAIFGVCGYIWTQYYDEAHEYLDVGYFLLIIFALFLNMSGRVAAMAIVMGTLGWVWLLVAVISPFLVNYAAYCNAAARAGPHSSTLHNICRYFSIVPLAILSAVTVSDQRVLTFITTLAWILSSLPYIINYHVTWSNWVVWLVPACAQIVALFVMMAKWTVFETAFQRFSRIAQMNQWIKVSPKDPEQGPNKD